jgi:small conductance mechanosensitive channel
MDTANLTRILLSSLLIVALTALGLVVVAFLGRRVEQGVESRQEVPEDRRQQLVTLIRAVRWVANVAILVTAVLMLLTTFNVNVGPLLASVGVLGLALSLGAQTLIKDYIGGVLILIENQYAVDDVIEVGDASGVVESITLRATRVRALNGDLYVVPNGDVRVVANKTRGWSRVLVDLGIAYEEDLDRVLGILEESATAFARDPRWEPLLLEPPQVLAVDSLGDWTANVRLMAKTRPGTQWEVSRALRKELLATCEREGIELPYPRQEVWVRSTAPGSGA